MKRDESTQTGARLEQGRTSDRSHERAAGRTRRSGQAPSTSRVRGQRRELAAVATEALAGIAGDRLAHPPVAVRFWDGSTIPPTQGEPAAPSVILRDRAAVAHLLREPNQLGLARAWVEGALDLEGDPGTVLRLRDRYKDLRLGLLERLRLAWAAARVAGPAVLRRPPVPSIEAQTHGRKHSLARDRSSVRHHYEVSNRFYELMLGPSMVYSCAYFHDRDDTLEAAQERKLETICRKLRLTAGERLLDIGCGWGSLLLHAARTHGVRGVGVTLSDAQAELARRRIAEQGLGDMVEVRVCDYRQIDDGPYDKVASVGMYEHVGRAKLGEYAQTVRRLLRPGGLFLNHGIARLYSDPPTGATFINRYIFPDGELHPVTDLLVALRAEGFEVRDLESLREHYVLTLGRWLENLESSIEQAEREVGAARVRAWKIYLLGSAQGFEDGEITLYQTLAVRDGAPHQLPLDRARLIAAPAAAG